MENPIFQVGHCDTCHASYSIFMTKHGCDECLCIKCQTPIRNYQLPTVPLIAHPENSVDINGIDNDEATQWVCSNYMEEDIYYTLTWFYKMNGMIPFFRTNTSAWHNGSNDLGKWEFCFNLSRDCVIRISELVIGGARVSISIKSREIITYEDKEIISFLERLMETIYLFAEIKNVAKLRAMNLIKMLDNSSSERMDVILQNYRNFWTGSGIKFSTGTSSGSSTIINYMPKTTNIGTTMNWQTIPNGKIITAKTKPSTMSFYSQTSTGGP